MVVASGQLYNSIISGRNLSLCCTLLHKRHKQRQMSTVHQNKTQFTQQIVVLSSSHLFSFQNSPKHSEWVSKWMFFFFLFFLVILQFWLLVFDFEQSLIGSSRSCVLEMSRFTISRSIRPPSGCWSFSYRSIRPLLIVHIRSPISSFTGRSICYLPLSQSIRVPFGSFGPFMCPFTHGSGFGGRGGIWRRQDRWDIPEGVGPFHDERGHAGGDQHHPLSTLRQGHRGQSLLIERRFLESGGGGGGRVIAGDFRDS